MLTKRYLASIKNLPDIFAQIVKGTAPDNFNIEHLKSIGFTSESVAKRGSFLRLVGDLIVGCERLSAFSAPTLGRAVYAAQVTAGDGGGRQRDLTRRRRF
jgi:hypothetical protein